MLGSLVNASKVLGSIDERLMECGVSRGSFLTFCSALMQPAPFGLADLMPNKTMVNLCACPTNPHTLLGIVLQFAASATLPELDQERRPKFAYDRDIHEHCPRRAHFDSGLVANPKEHKIVVALS